MYRHVFQNRVENPSHDINRLNTCVSFGASAGPGMPRKILWKERCSEAVIMMCYVQMHNSRKFGAVHVTQKQFECEQT